MKGIFSWNVPSVLKGDPRQFAALLKAGGFERVDVKISDGPFVFWPSRSAFPGWGENVHPDLIAALRDVGIEVWGWGFHYGEDPAGEANIVISQLSRFNLSGYIVDVEGRFEGRGDAVARAHTLMGKLRKPFPTLSMAFCSFAEWHNPWNGVQWHNRAMYLAFMEHCDYIAPMMYWEGSSAANAVWLAETSIKQWRELAPSHKLMPVGRAYVGDGGKPAADAMVAFDKRVRELGADAISWWLLDYAYMQDDLWQTLVKTTPFKTPDTPPPAQTNDVNEAVRALQKWAQTLGFKGPMLI